MPTHALHDLLHRIHNASRAAGRPVPRLLPVGKRHPPEALRGVAEAMREAIAAGTMAPPPCFGENYVQEALAKQQALGDPGLEWHLIGHLQSNKAREAARAFDWVQTVDRAKLVDALARERPDDRPPLQVLVQVNIDGEASKHGCRPQDVAALAEAIAGRERLRLRGLMAIPAPGDADGLRDAFRRMRALFERLRQSHPGMDTLSMGMSDDLELAIAEGSTMLRVGTALFGPRPA